MKGRYTKRNSALNKQVGGVIINADPKEAFNDFLSNSTFQYVSKGSYGMTFKATLNAGVTSPYSRLDYGGEVRHLLIKLGLLYDFDMTEDQQRDVITKFSRADSTESVSSYGSASSQPEEDEEDVIIQITDGSGFSDKIDLTTCKMHSFIDEVNIQTDIFLKTMNYLQPICPAIVYSGIINSRSDDFKTLMDKMIAGATVVGSRTQTKELLDGILGQRSGFHNLGIIGMEFADNCVLLASMTQTVSKAQFESATNIGLYLLLKLAIDTGYTHGDYHPGNIFINTKQRNYFEPYTGGALLIDFGFAQKIPIAILKRIKEYYSTGNYTEALKQLCLMDRADGLIMSDYPDFYGFACGTYNYYSKEETADFPHGTNGQIAWFVRARETAIDSMIRTFEQRHAADPNIPLLPLSNKIKNSMYSGLIHRGGRKKVIRKNRNNTRKNKKRATTRN